MDSPRSVSVVIPTIREQFVSRAVSAALSQEGVVTEVIVVADGPEVAGLEQKLEQSDRVRVLYHPNRRGVSRARNEGARLASHDWIALLDYDDIWAPNKLKRQLAALDEQGGDFAYCSAAVLDGDLGLVRYEDAPPYPELLDALTANNLLPATASNLLVSKPLYEEVGGCDLQLKHFADWDLGLKVARAGRGAVCPEPLVGYVHHDEGMHVQMLDDVGSEWQLFRRNWAAAGLDLGSVDQIRWAADGHRRRGQPVAAARVYLRAARRFGHVSDLGRALGALLGERARLFARSLQSRRAAPPGPPPDWVALYS